MSIMSLGCALTGSFASLLAVRLVQGIGVGGEMPVAAAYINELSKARGRGRFFLLYELIFPIGLMAAGQIGALAVPAFGWRVMFLIGGVPGLIVSTLLMRLPESPRWLVSRGRLSEAARVIAGIEASGAPATGPGATADTPHSRPVPPGDPRPAGGRARWTELMSPVYRSRTL